MSNTNDKKNKKLNKHDEESLDVEVLEERIFENGEYFEDKDSLKDEKDFGKGSFKEDQANKDASDEGSHILNYRKTKKGNKIVEEYTIIEDNPNKKEDLVDIAAIKAKYNELAMEDGIIEPDDPMYADFYDNLLRDSEIFPEADINDTVLEEAPENVLELEDTPQLSR